MFWHGIWSWSGTWMNNEFLWDWCRCNAFDAFRPSFRGFPSVVGLVSEAFHRSNLKIGNAVQKYSLFASANECLNSRKVVWRTKICLHRPSQTRTVDHCYIYFASFHRFSVSSYSRDWPLIGNSSTLGNFRPLFIERLSNDLLANCQYGAKTWTEIDPHDHPNVEFPRHHAATEIFLNILVHADAKSVCYPLQITKNPFYPWM
jgi:hypothetical protein